MILFCELTEYRVSTVERQKCGLDMWDMLHVFPPDVLTVVSTLCPDTTGQLTIISSPVCGPSLTVDCASSTDKYVQLDFSSLSTRGNEHAATNHISYQYKQSLVDFILIIVQSDLV